jgi:hypothetical protein
MKAEIFKVSLIMEVSKRMRGVGVYTRRSEKNQTRFETAL